MLKPTILVIDDDPSILEVVKEILTYENYQVISLISCHDILAEIECYKPNLVIMDYFQIGVTGGTFCRTIKSNTATAHLPVMLYSAYPDIKQSADHFGCDDFLEKPFSIVDLVLKVKNLLN
ncbi:MAG: response regulator [Sphingobacteriaceae bacterium]|nr:MAG: response regulator [Sphingobacteriaceae bacterium]